MTRPFALFAITALAFAPQVAFGQDKKDATAEMLAKLRKPVDLAGADALSLREFAEFISDRHGVQVLVNGGSFAGEENPMDMMVKLPKVKGLPLAAALRLSLADKSLTFLVRKGHIEIV